MARVMFPLASSSMTSGLREGSTENASVARALLVDLAERELSTERAVLFVVDG